MKPQSDHSFYANLSFFSGCESSFSLSMKGSENPPPYATTITTCFAQESPIGGWSLIPNSYQRSDRFSLVFVVEVQATQARVRSLLISSMKVLLGMKKRGFGEDM